MEINNTRDYLYMIVMILITSSICWCFYQNITKKLDKLHVYISQENVKSESLYINNIVLNNENEYYQGLVKFEAIIKLTECADIPEYYKENILKKMNFEKDILQYACIKELGEHEFKKLRG